MSTRSSETPLLAMDAVVLDTETTGLDPAKARIVQIGAVKIDEGQMIEAATFDQLVDPGIPIPPSSTEIHHISDSNVAGAPEFKTAYSAFGTFANGAVIIGHSIGYDLAIMKRECAIAGLDWAPPRSLDIRLLAQISNPNLAGFSLDQLAAWLDVEISGRHTALGDALATAQVFLAMLPNLREGGIRTLAEAEAACRQLTNVLEEHHRAGWHEPVVSPAQADAESTLARIDSYPYRHRVCDVMTSPPVVLSSALTVGETVKKMMDLQISSAFLAPPVDGGKPPAAEHHPIEGLGIVTERDILRTIAKDGANSLSKPVSQLMSQPLAVIPQDAYIYRAMGRMDRLGIRHLAVAEEHGELVGALSARDLLRLRAGEAISLGDEIESAETANALAVAWAKLPGVARSLLDEEVESRDIAGVISREIGALTRQAAVIAERRMIDAGRGGPPVPHAVLILGSGGRGESLLAADQDNAIIFTEGDPDGPEDKWFAEYGSHIADILHAVGVPYCNGGVMAKNAQWRGSVETWRERVSQWVRRSRPQDLLQVDIFFDLRAVHGEAKLARNLMIDAYQRGSEATEFAKLLAGSTTSFSVPLNFFGGFKTEDGRVDLKKGGLFPIVSSARVLAIRHNLVKRSTGDRLQAILDLNIGARGDITSMVEAHGVLLGHILAQQFVDLQAGKNIGNSIEVKRLSKSDSEKLRDHLSSLSHMEEMVRDLLFR